jgi:outer membrane protein assembly factor BamB
MITPRRKNDPDQFGAFRVIGRLGKGGFGNVYVAGRRGWTGELVAVKVMHSRLAGNADFRFRFAQEIQAIERVNSEYIPGLKGHDADDEAVWLATELVRGPSLQQVVERSGPLPEWTIWRLALGMARALCDIHGAGLVHRDLKPGNVLLVREGPRIIDFGLAHLTEADHQTASGLPLCSPAYAPPEQRRRLRDADKAADIFTLGGTLLFAATGHAPYGGEWDPLPAAPNLAGLPNALGDVISHCLYHDERARPSLAELVAYFAFQADTAAGHDEPAFASVLTAGITKVIGTWHRELDEVTRSAGAGPAGAGPWDEPGPARLPTPGMRPTAPYPDAPARTVMFPRDRDDGRITLPEPAVGASQPFGGQRDDLRWKVQLGDWVRAPVTVTRDMAVAASLGGVVTCFDVRSGNVLGQANLGAPVRSAVLLPGGPHAGRAYAGADDGVVYQIDLASGRYRPLLYATGAIEGPPVAVGGRIYALSADGCVYEADAHTSGEAAVLCDLGVPALGTLTVADGTVIAASAEGCVYAIDTAERAVRWHLPTSGLIFGAPAAVAGWLYIAGTDGQLWSARIDDRRRRTMLDIGAPVHTAPVHDRGRLYVGGGDGKVRAFDISGTCAAKPALLWTRGVIGGEVSGIAALGGTVVAAAGRTLTALDGASGEPRASSSPGTLMTAAPVLNEDLVYVAGLDGTVSCLSMAG